MFNVSEIAEAAVKAVLEESRNLKGYDETDDETRDDILRILVEVATKAVFREIFKD